MNSKSITSVYGFLIGASIGVVANILSGWPSPASVIGFAIVGMLVAYAYTSRNEL